MIILNNKKKLLVFCVLRKLKTIKKNNHMTDT